MINVGIGGSKTVPLELLLQFIQDELCQGCPVKKYSNRNCDRCPNNISKQLQERVD